MKEDTSPVDGEAPPAHSGRNDGVRWLAPLAACGIAALLLALFYAEENWRGKRAWAKTKAEFEAQHDSLDWANYLPAEPPEDLNIMKAPGMEDLFINGRISNFQIPSIFPRIAASNRVDQIRYGLVQFVAGAETAGLPGGTRVFQFAGLKTNSLQANEISRVFLGGILSTPQGSIVSERKPGEGVRRVYLQTERIPAIKEILEAFKGTENDRRLGAPDSLEQITTNVFALIIKPGNWTGAAELLESSSSASNIFAIIHEAVKRPRCWLPGDYSVPYDIPMPNFVRARTLAQLRGARAQAHILLNNPQGAMEEIRGIDEINRVLLTEPPTLVSSMIRVAISGLKTAMIEEGFAAGIWSEQHWREFQETNSTIKLLPPVFEAMRGTERAGVCRTMETTAGEDLPKVFGFNAPGAGMKPEALMLRLMPRGWVQQNTVVYARLMRDSLNAIEPEAPFIDPIKSQAAADRVMEEIERYSPTTILARIGIPNFRKAIQTAVKNQTYLNEVVVASALERYRKNSASYPESLEELVPKYLEKVPIDLILGKPLRYQKRANGQYALYSLGWDAKDDLAKALASPQPTLEEAIASVPSDADWVWKGVAPGPEKTASWRAQK